MRAPSPAGHAIRLGLVRGLIEFRQRVTSLADVSFTAFWAVAYVVVLVLQRDSTVEGTSVSLALMTLPGLVGLMIASSGIMDVAGILATEREDGTLLRAKAIPNGMVGYLTAKIVSSSLSTLAGAAIVLLAGLAVVPDLIGTAGWSGWLTLLGVCLLGLLATVPWGAIIGSMARTPGAVFGLAMLPVIGITAISGIFYPLTALPGWLQTLGQAFPIYWLGLGTRAALLPDAAALAEVDRSWRTAQTFGMLGLWTVVGLLLAPVLLRRMARRESGADLQERRDKAIQRYT